MSFAIGQRWISHADLELGLGICVEADTCLLYTSDAADDMQCVDLGGRRII